MILSHPSFDGLMSLQILDLSRNRLSSAPAEAFSYLSWLTNLNLDLNSWNCSCQLLELAVFLSTFIQQPDKVQEFLLSLCTFPMHFTCYTNSNIKSID